MINEDIVRYMNQWDSKVMAKGEAIAAAGGVGDIVPVRNKQQAGRVEILVDGSRGSVYVVRLQVGGGVLSKETSCTCPVKKRCKHAAAALHHPDLAGLTLEPTMAVDYLEVKTRANAMELLDELRATRARETSRLSPTELAAECLDGLKRYEPEIQVEKLIDRWTIDNFTFSCMKAAQATIDALDAGEEPAPRKLLSEILHLYDWALVPGDKEHREAEEAIILLEMAIAV